MLHVTYCIEFALRRLKHAYFDMFKHEATLARFGLRAYKGFLVLCFSSLGVKVKSKHSKICSLAEIQLF